MPQSLNKSVAPRAKRHRLGLVFLLFWLVVLSLVALNWQNIQDWQALRNYHPPAAVAQLANQDTMTPYARKLFYVNHPDIEDKAMFVKSCPNNGGEQTIILGCYHGGQHGIFVLSVSDPRLDGVLQVTAGHEMLHAAYDRLSSADRNKVDAMLMDYYNHGLHDQRIQAVIAAYKKTEPQDVVNEMHSVFSTEIASLPAPLEAYYKRYFTNRQQVARFAAQYQQEFTSRHDAVKQDDAQLAQWKAQIDSLNAELQLRQTLISQQQQTLQAQRASGNYQAYNAGVPDYNALVDQYNAEVSQLKLLITQYNQLVVARNSIVLQEQQLNSELSTKANTIQQ